MTEIEKICWTCKHRELDISLPPCADCVDLLHDFHEYKNWEKQDE